MEYKERFLMYADICERAEKEFPDIKQRRMSNMMDIESADKAFNLELEEWLKADNENFFHDFFGIIHNADRSKGFPCTFGLFVPRYANAAL